MHQVTVQATTFSHYSHRAAAAAAAAAASLLCAVSYNTQPLDQNSKWKIFVHPDSATERAVFPQPFLPFSHRCKHLHHNLILQNQLCEVEWTMRDQPGSLSARSSGRSLNEDCLTPAKFTSPLFNMSRSKSPLPS